MVLMLWKTNFSYLLCNLLFKLLVQTTVFLYLYVSNMLDCRGGGGGGVGGVEVCPVSTKWGCYKVDIIIQYFLMF